MTANPRLTHEDGEEDAAHEADGEPLQPRVEAQRGGVQDLAGGEAEPLGPPHTTDLHTDPGEAPSNPVWTCVSPSQRQGPLTA